MSITNTLNIDPTSIDQIGENSPFSTKSDVIDQKASELGKKCSQIILNAFVENPKLFSTTTRSLDDLRAIAKLKKTITSILSPKDLPHKEEIINGCFRCLTRKHIGKSLPRTLGNFLKSPENRVSERHLNSLRNKFEDIRIALEEAFDNVLGDAKSNPLFLENGYDLSEEVPSDLYQVVNFEADLFDGPEHPSLPGHPLLDVDYYHYLNEVRSAKDEEDSQYLKDVSDYLQEDVDLVPSTDYLQEDVDLVPSTESSQELRNGSTTSPTDSAIDSSRPSLISPKLD